MAGMHADIAGMEAGAKHIEDVSGQMQQVLGVVRDKVAGTAGNWEGAAAGSFRRVMDDYDAKSKRLADVLQSIATMIRDNGRGYEAAEQDNESALSSVAAMMDGGSPSSLNI